MIRLLLGVALLFAAPGVASASDCYGIELDPYALGLARVTAADADGRLHFSADANGRPCLQPRCRAKAFVVKGDDLITGQRESGFVCAWFKPKGRQVSEGTIGWLRADALTALAVPETPPPAAWAGKWVRDRTFGMETSLTVRPAGAGKLKVAGLAFFAHSPADIARGAVNDGEIDTTIEVRGRVAGQLIPGPGGKRRSLEPNYDGTDDGCKFGLALLGDWLFVADDTTCGGLNVSFTGVYRHDR